MADSSDEFIDDLVFVMGIGVLFYVILGKMRDQLGAQETGLNFTGAEPSQNPVTGLIDILAPMQTSATGQSFIKENEGLTLTPQPDADGQVIGWGHFIPAGQQAPASITQAQAEAYFSQDIRAAEKAVNGALTVQVNQDQFDALVDLAFNIGGAAFASSTLVQKLNAGDFAGAEAEFQRWDLSGGQVNAGLQNRRSEEQQMFDSGTAA